MSGLYYAVRPVTLRIAVGPPGSGDQKLIQAMAETFARGRNAVRLSPTITEGAAQSLVETERAVKAVRAATSVAAAGGKEFRYWLDLPMSACNCHRMAMNARRLEHFE